MATPFASLDTRLRRLPEPALLAIGLAVIAGLTAIGTTPDHGVPVDDIFVIPVVGVGWLTHSRGYGYVAALVAAVASVWMAVAGPSAAPLGQAVIAGVARLVLYAIVLSLLTAMRRMQLAHEAEARTDSLTGAANARAFRDLALAEVERSQRYQHELSLAYVDIDDFKSINDRSGHADGDRVLQEASQVMRSVVRSVDTVARLGGDEFAILMPETGPSEARALVERFRRDVSGLSTKPGRPVGCSIGLVTFKRPPGSLEELVAAADELMYAAKQHGKDRMAQAERTGSYVSANGESGLPRSLRKGGHGHRGARD